MILQTSHLFRAVVATLAATAATCLAAPATCCSGAELPLPVRTVYQFTTETWIENLAVRPNGNLLLIVDENVTSPVHPVALYQLANPASPHPELSLVYSFPLGTVLGITEVQHEVYAVLAENFTGNFESVPGTTKMYTFDFNGGADMYAASVWAVNITTGTTRLFAQAPEMAQVHNYTRMGINGLRVAYDYLYFTNSDLKCVFRIPMDVTGAQASPNWPG
ncbi:uncharacterized protein THITE_2142617 [Thermothielavioides terrestris NRRL 8126]|uniref:Uncharacterized protein n=1 Tax=Thermothielavioides terrestris (strain ATCC 38088 / NRRL 8126) TaxID=578455 RepID=G2QX46_THETT|nr:uncharacterized protein THITE_2142617 [Thermothielavioides terrestris NRRL 8126]AEO64813.1 hypothetical protein THITE_2142617 [Thermothielavioides terrestris NRRL 8126]